jgi:hypothetical protein
VKLGDNVPWLSASALSVLLVASAAPRVTVTVYVFVVTESPAVTTIVMVFATPATSSCGADALPKGTFTVDTVTTASSWFVVGVTVTDGTPFATLIV